MPKASAAGDSTHFIFLFFNIFLRKIIQFVFTKITKRFRDSLVGKALFILFFLGFIACLSLIFEASSEPNLYHRIGVTRTTPRDEIRRAYKEFTLENHPDKARSRYMSNEYILKKEAYEVLMRTDSRIVYDKFNIISPTVRLSREGNMRLSKEMVIHNCKLYLMTFIVLYFNTMKDVMETKKYSLYCMIAMLLLEVYMYMIKVDLSADIFDMIVPGLSLYERAIYLKYLCATLTNFSFFFAILFNKSPVAQIQRTIQKEFAPLFQKMNPKKKEGETQSSDLKSKENPETKRDIPTPNPERETEKKDDPTQSGEEAQKDSKDEVKIQEEIPSSQPETKSQEIQLTEEEKVIFLKKRHILEPVFRLSHVLNVAIDPVMVRQMMQKSLARRNAMNAQNQSQNATGSPESSAPNAAQ